MLSRVKTDEHEKLVKPSKNRSIKASERRGTVRVYSGDRYSIQFISIGNHLSISRHESNCNISVALDYFAPLFVIT